MSVRLLEEEIKKLYPKEEKETNEEVETPLEASATAFVNDNPLMPTADLPEDEDNYGKVTIAPPEGDDEMPTTNKFINYGELDKEEDEDEDDEDNSLDMPPAVTSLDIKDVKENTEDININNSGSADLDSLLNLGNPTSATPSNEFITPAEKIVKTDSMDDDEDNETNSDYFQLPDEIPTVSEVPLAIPPVEEPTPAVNLPTINPLNATETNNDNKYTLEEATAKIKELVKELEEHGVKVKSDEMDFEKSYQVIIKIDKTEE